jgi:hypothetical protein
MNRWANGREAMNSLDSIDAFEKMCQWDVDYVLLNRAELPLVQRQFREAPWLLPDFYKSRVSITTSHLREVEVVNSVHILEFAKEMCTN